MSKLTAEDFRNFQLFAGFRTETLATIAAACMARDFGQGELVIGHRDTTFDVFFLLSGKLQASLYSADGQRVGFHEMAPGVMFGEISAVDGQPRSVSVEAAQRCRIATMPRDRFLAMIESEPSFAMAVARQLAAQVRRLTTRVFEFSTMAVRQRLRAELLRLARNGGAVTSGTATIDPVPTHAELASRISTHREAVSREMAWLENNGVLAKKGRSLVVPDILRLRDLLEESFEG